MDAPQPDDDLRSVALSRQSRDWREGRRVPAEQYRDTDPRLRSDSSALVAVVFGEYLLRGELGESPTPDEYLARFPELAGELRKLFAVAAALKSAGLAETEAVPAPGRRVPGLPPPQIEGFEVLDYIDGGGQADVWRARQLGLDRVVALKVLRPETALSPDHQARFRREGRTLARLDHPNVVRVIACDAADGRLYLAMEYLGGGSLRDRLKGRRLDPAGAAGLIATVADAVAAAHRAGVTHRDLKPGNVLFTAAGVPKVTDFGLVKLLDGETINSASGSLMGTIPYMAPEQAAGRTRSVGPHTDVWAMGVMLYEALAGRLPFRGESELDTLDRIRFTEPTPLAEAVSGVPPALAAICGRCLMKESPRRYRDAGELAGEMRRFLVGEAPALADPGPQSADHPDVPGYEIRRQLGGGDHRMRYFLARRTSDGREAMVKLFGNVIRPADIDRYCSSALPKLRNLDHPNLAAVFDAGRLRNGEAYLAQEYLHGGGLREWTSGGPQPVDQVVRVVEALARAMQVVHAAGLIHGNLEPANVRFAADGTPRTVETGLVNQPDGAGRHHEELSTTMVADVFGWVGNVYHLAPEILRRDPITPAADIYGLGTILYFLLTGESPFRGESYQGVMGHAFAGKRPGSPGKIRPDLPRALTDICEKCLNPRPKDRFDSAEQLADELARVIKDGESEYGTRDDLAGPGVGTASPDDLLDIPGYKVLGEVGRDGLAQVHKAIHLDSGAEVALKIILGRLDDDRIKRRLRREAALLGSLHHQNFPRVYGSGEHRGLWYLAVEFVEGGTLSRITNGRPHDIASAVPFMGEAAAAVGYLHERGIIHRDLKPANILLAARPGATTESTILADFRPMIIDLALASQLGWPTEETEGMILGTPSYMAPEQAAGKVNAIGPHTDVYGLGCVLYEILTGRVTFRGPTALDTITSVLEGSVVPPRQLRTDLPRGLEEICLRCLARSPADRYPNGSALAAALGGFAQSGRTSGLWGRLRFWRKD
jgi:serine/threonine protein kinase